jgi:hypothetical protein
MTPYLFRLDMCFPPPKSAATRTQAATQLVSSAANGRLSDNSARMQSGLVNVPLDGRVAADMIEGVLSN